jgi:hypothetical protein
MIIDNGFLSKENQVKVAAFAYKEYLKRGKGVVVFPYGAESHYSTLEEFEALVGTAGLNDLFSFCNPEDDYIIAIQDVNDYQVMPFQSKINPALNPRSCFERIYGNN